MAPGLALAATKYLPHKAAVRQSRQSSTVMPECGLFFPRAGLEPWPPHQHLHGVLVPQRGLQPVEGAQRGGAVGSRGGDQLPVLPARRHRRLQGHEHRYLEGDLSGSWSKKARHQAGDQLPVLTARRRGRLQGFRGAAGSTEAPSADPLSEQAQRGSGPGVQLDGGHQLAAHRNKALMSRLDLICRMDLEPICGMAARERTWMVDTSWRRRAIRAPTLRRNASRIARMTSRCSMLSRAPPTICSQGCSLVCAVLNIQRADNVKCGKAGSDQPARVMLQGRSGCRCMLQPVLGPCSPPAETVNATPGKPAAEWPGGNTIPWLLPSLQQSHTYLPAHELSQGQDSP